MLFPFHQAELEAVAVNRKEKGQPAAPVRVVAGLQPDDRPDEEL